MKVPTAKKLPSGAYRVQVMVDGNRVSITDSDPKVAIAKAAAVKAKMEEARRSPRSLTVGEAIDRYIESKDAVLSPSTVAGYKRIRENALQGIMDVKLPDLTQEKVQREVNKMAKEKSPKSVRNAHGLLTAALAEYHPDFVLRTTLPQKQRYDAATPSTEDIKAIIKAARGTAGEIAILLAIWLGLRMSEIRGLKWTDIDGDTLRIRRAIVDEGEKTTKTYSSQRDLHIPAYLKELLSKEPHDAEYIVNLGRHGIYERFQRVCKAAGVQHYRFHDLRHINASVMLALGVPDKYAMERMGHATNNMLKTVYQHTMESEREKISGQIDAYFSALVTEESAEPDAIETDEDTPE